MEGPIELRGQNGRWLMAEMSYLADPYPIRIATESETVPLTYEDAHRLLTWLIQALVPTEGVL